MSSENTTPRLLDHFETEREFSQVLEDANENATSEAEMNFIDSLSAQHERWGAQMFMSEPQANWLRKIAGG